MILPPHIKIQDLLVALDAAGCDPRPVGEC
jgi:hypothetical protein